MKDPEFYFWMVVKAIAFVLGLIGIYMVLLKVTGHSPTFEAINTFIFIIIGIFLSFILTEVVKLKVRFTSFKIKNNYEHREIMRLLSHHDERLSDHTKKLSEISQNLNSLRKDFNRFASSH